MKKKLILGIILIMVTIIGALALAGCSAGFDSKAKITVVSREDGSGTRSGFDDIVGLKGDSKLSDAATILTSTGAVMTKVNSSMTSIGYISLGSLNDTVKSVSIGGVVPTAATVKDMTYALQRNFNIVTKKGIALSAATTDFIAYINSKQGQDIAVAAGYVSATNTGNYATAKNSVTGTIAISGSSSVSPLMEKIKKSYENEQTGVRITINSTDSGSGVSDVNNSSESQAPNTIGMISRELKTAEAPNLDNVKIAIDGIAVIVNNKNTLTNLTIDQLRDIFSGKVTTYAEVIA